MPVKKPIGGVQTHAAWLLAGKLLADEEGYAVYDPDTVYLSMQQHIGAPCKPTVEVGQRVLVGEMVGDAEAKVAAPVHTGVSGTVRAIRDWPRPGGGVAETVIVENDHKYEPLPREKRAVMKRPAEEMIAMVRAAGIVGMGGATFPTAIKLDTGGRKIDTCILNGAECEPGLSADNALMLGESERVVRGLRLAMEICGAAHGIIAIEADKPRAIAVMRQVCAEEEGISVEELPSVYPQGGEKQLIYTLTGRQVPLGGGLPADVGVVVVNVGTAAGMARAIDDGLPVTSRICTVTGDVAKPKNVRFPLGTLAGDLVDFCGGFKGEPARVVIGGPMMGKTIESLMVPMEKGSNGVLVYAKEHAHLYTESPCIRCNRCIEVCPMKLVPWAIDRACHKQQWKTCGRLRAEGCINCGCCTYICPATRRLAEKITEARGELMRRAREEAKGDG